MRRQARLAVALVLVGRQLLEHALAQLGLQAVGQRAARHTRCRSRRRARTGRPAAASVAPNGGDARPGAPAAARPSGASCGTSAASWRRSSGSSTTRRASEPLRTTGGAASCWVSPSTASSPTGQRARMPASARRKITSSLVVGAHAHLVHQRGLAVVVAGVRRHVRRRSRRTCPEGPRRSAARDRPAGGSARRRARRRATARRAISLKVRCITHGQPSPRVSTTIR